MSTAASLDAPTPIARAIGQDIVRGRLGARGFILVHFPRGLRPGRSKLYQVRPQLGVAFGFSQSDALAGTLQAFLWLFDHGDLTRRSATVRSNRSNAQQIRSHRSRPIRGRADR